MKCMAPICAVEKQNIHALIHQGALCRARRGAWEPILVEKGPATWLWKAAAVAGWRGMDSKYLQKELGLAQKCASPFLVDGLF